VALQRPARHLLWIVCACIVAIWAAPGFAQNAGKAVILSVNDIYRLKGVDGGKAGGMHRLRALRAEIEATVPDMLLVHGGDFLSPSFLGRTYKGAQMIDLMNVMDGDPRAGRFDDRMFVAFGNHEFDDTHCSKAGPLADLVTSSEFTWLASNFDFNRCDTLSALTGNARIAKTRVVQSGGLKLGLYGVTLPLSNYAAVADDPVTTSCRYAADLRAQGVDVVIAVTHLPWRMDLELLGLALDGTALPADQRKCLDAPDIALGGHDHDALALPSRAPRLFKADADAISAQVVELEKTNDGEIRVNARLVYLNQDRPADPLAERLADQWLLRHDERFCLRDCIGRTSDALKQCLAAVADGACLKQPIARTADVIATEEIANRSRETGFGDWLADRVREAAGADIAFLNAGGIRLNYDLAAGTVVTRRHLEQMFPFKNKLAVRSVPGGDLWRAIEHAVRKRGEGAWAHFSGMTVQLHVADGRQKVARVVVKRTDGSLLELRAESTEPVSVASISFLFADGDGHGFRLCAEEIDVWSCKSEIEARPDWPLKGDGADLAGFVRLKLVDAGFDPGLHLPVDRRLCDPGQTDCLIERWSAND